MPYARVEDKRNNDKNRRLRDPIRAKEYLKQWRSKNIDYEDRRFKDSPWRFLRNLHYGIWKRPGQHNLTLEHLWQLWEQQRGRCALSGIKMTHRRVAQYFDTNISMDRIDNNKGYDIGNVRLVCRRINGMRSNMTDSDFKFWCELVVRGPEDSRSDFYVQDRASGLL